MSELEVGGGNVEERKGWLKSVNPSVIGFLIPITGAALYMTLGLLDNTTELKPSHDLSLVACFCFAGAIALLIATFVTRRAKNVGLGTRIWTAIATSLAGFIFVVIFGLRIVHIVNGWIDFPTQKTQTFQALLRISRAYQTHGKGASTNIQTAPLWTDMNVTRADYDFMRNHRRPGDTSIDRDEISSRGYFCAKVTMQRSGDALRVLHAGSGKLPTGSVIVCPDMQPPAPVRIQ